VDATTSTHLFRIAQEAVNNAVRHSRASEIRISLTKQQRQLSLEVWDNGVGIDSTAATRRSGAADTWGMGLRIMDYRAGMIGGQFHIERSEAGGTLVRCTVPWK
jgi:signal transduction histidine kinase